MVIYNNAKNLFKKKNQNFKILTFEDTVKKVCAVKGEGIFMKVKVICRHMH